MADLQVLNNELTTDPLGRGYSGMTDAEAATDLNTVYRTRTRDYVFGWEIFNETDDAEYDALTGAKKDSWDALCAIEQINTTSGVAKAREAELFGAGTVTRANLAALRIENISRASELGQPVVTAGDVAQARAYPA